MKIPIRQYWVLLHTYLRPQWRRILVLALLLALKITAHLINPQVVGRFLDQVLAGTTTGTLLRSGALFLAIAAAGQILTVISKYVSETVSWTATNALRLDLLRHILGLDMAFHKAHRPGELTERIDTDVDVLSNFFSRFAVNIVGNGILAIGILVLFFQLGWQYGVAFTAYAIVGLAVMMRLRNVATPFWTKLHEVQAQFYGFLGEQFSGTEDIRANGAQDYVLRRLYRFFRRWMPINRDAALAGYSGWMTNAALVAAGEMLAIAISGYFFFRGELTIGQAYLIDRYMGLLFGQVAELRWQITDLQHADAGIQRVQALLNRRPRVADGTGAPLPDGPLSVAFDAVSFAYDDEEPSDSRLKTQDSPLATRDSSVDDLVLSDITFNLAPGHTLGLLGRTGSGKTTLARLLLRLYDPVEGQVRLADRALTETTVADVRRRVALVTQEVQLFQATVRQNLTLFDPVIEDDSILKALNDLGLDSWLAELPDGLDTELGAAGAGLSAGQAQLLAFARVFLADPDLVILDEASSRLDPATERLIERAVDLLLADRTGIIIAHRLNTIQRASEIMILENGHIREAGARVALAQKTDSYFHHLLQTGMEEVLE